MTEELDEYLKTSGENNQLPYDFETETLQDHAKDKTLTRNVKLYYSGIA